SYPFREVNKEEEYYKLFTEINNGNYLFSKDGFWHGGIHFSDTVLTKVKATQGIRAIADGELVAFRINSEYLQNDNEEDLEGLYSNGFFLIRHFFEYPIGNKLTFFSLYMHTAKLSDYDFSTHKMLKKDTIRSVEKYVDSSTGAIEDLEKDTKLTLGELNEYGRYQIVQVDGQNRTGICTVDKGSVIPIEDVLKLKTINTNTTASNNTQFPDAPIIIKAGEILGLVGEYNRSKQINRELLHLEVFTKDDVKSFSDTAKSTYVSDTSEDKPKPIKIKIPKDKDIYEIKEQSVIDSSDGTATIKDSTGTKLTTPAPLSNGTKVEIDTSIVVLSNRYKLLKIKTDDVSSNNWNIYKGSIGKIKVAENTNTKQSADKIVLMKDVKIITLDNKKYIYINEDKTQALLYTDCEKIHPITFDWATIINESSSDDVSIFENIKRYLLPEFVEDELKINPLYKELFKLIDKDTNGQIEAQELDDASKEIAIKQLTSKYIVKHSSEWDKTINLPYNVKQILEEYKDNIKNYDKIKQHLENEEKRVANLNFFNECISIDGFPSSDKVFHFNPIGLVGEFGTNSCYCGRDFTVDEVKNIVEELRNSESFLEGDYALFTIKTNIPSSDKTYEKFTEKLNKTFNKYDINTCIRKIHFLAQIYHETNRFRSSEEEGSSSYLSGKSYYPFYGRGLMQLTWKGNSGSGHTGYKQYFDYLNRTDYLTNYNEVGSDIELVFDSAGWFWEQGKTLSSSTPGTWNAPSFPGIVGTAVGNEQASSEKQILSYGNTTQIYGTLNLNLLADNDWIDTISWLVNGGGNGFQERRDYLKDIKGIMDYENCINKN
ncbi:hypothetical protein, partial [Arcobacter sp.]|uniref:hypothetical protein n=1 Tax=Arcobacter sp. TaxID=1872629 RepID=UPI003C74E273